jgi:nucleoside-diphosphate-sugar epimerase
MILVVGGAGYVGSVLVRELLERGYAVKVFDRLYYGDQGIRDVAERIKLAPGDVRTLDLSVLDGVDAVINLSGLSNDPTAEYNPKANFEMNTQATEFLAGLCKKKGIRRFIFASSCSIYDVGIGNDEKDIVLDEESPVNPKAAYSSSKYQAERSLLAMSGSDFSPVILRKGTIYGFSPRMRYDLVVNTFLKDALSKGHLTIHYGGEMWRPLVDVRDAARAYITCLEADEHKVKGEIFNVVYGNPPRLPLPRRSQLSRFRQETGARSRLHSGRFSGRSREGYGREHRSLPIQRFRQSTLLQHCLDETAGGGGPNHQSDRFGV